MSEVIQIGDFAFKRKQREYLGPKADCKHLHMTLDSNGDIVECTDCGKQISAYWALQMLADHYQQAHNKVRAAAHRLAEDKATNIVLLAAKKVQSAWRSQTMVPACPHCGRGIFPQDGLGSAAINKAMELCRRTLKKDTQP